MGNEGIRAILKTGFGIDRAAADEVNIGHSAAANYKIHAPGEKYFLKIYDKNKTQYALWTENIDAYVPILIWLNENTRLRGRIVSPIRTAEGGCRYDDDDCTALLFEYIDGEAFTENSLTRGQLREAAGIIACLHDCMDEIPVNTDKIKEDFSVPFCLSLDNFIKSGCPDAPDDVKAALEPYLGRLADKCAELRLLAERAKLKGSAPALCHTDAHYKNFMRGEHLVLVDWEGMKLAPPEADLFMFTQRRYWDAFIKRYRELRPWFAPDGETLYFYVLRRKIEDIWAFLESILYDNLSEERRMIELSSLTGGCRRLEERRIEF